MTNTARRLPSINVPDHIKNADAYIRSAQLRIAANAAKSARRRWIAESGEEVVRRCIDFLHECGEFARIEGIDRFGETHFHIHPVVRASFGDFRTKMIQSESEWGRLTKGQEQAVLRMIEQAHERIAAREAAKAQKAATAKHIGTVGERGLFTVTVRKILTFDTYYGRMVLNIMEDEAGNTIIYKGNKGLAGEGAQIVIKATVKAHDYRDGVAQTIISRPTAK